MAHETGIAPEFKALTRLFLDVSQYDPHDPVTTREFPRSFCSWIGGSNLPEAKAAIEDYDRSMNAPGAWQARCGDADGVTPKQHHRDRAGQTGVSKWARHTTWGETSR